MILCNLRSMIYTGVLSVLLLCSSCASSSILGVWECEEFRQEHDLFTVTGHGVYEYLNDGRYVAQIELLYTFNEKGTLKALISQPGSYSIESTSMIEVTEEIELISFETQLEIEKEALEYILGQNFKPGDIYEYEVGFPSSSKAIFSELDSSKKHSCERK